MGAEGVVPRESLAQAGQPAELQREFRDRTLPWILANEDSCHIANWPADEREGLALRHASDPHQHRSRATSTRK